MAVELQWTESSVIIEEPFSNTSGTTYTFTLKNIGTNSAQEVGLYIKSATLEGDVDNPSSDGVLADWYDALTKGEAAGSPAPGFHIIQGLSDVRCNFVQGDSAERSIPLTVGSGTDSDQLAPDEEVEIQMKYVPEAGDPVRRLYIEIGLVFAEV